MRAIAATLVATCMLAGSGAWGRNLLQAPAAESSLAEELCVPLPGPLGLLSAEAEEGTLNAIVEIAAGTKVKYEVDKETGLIFVDRILSSSVVYPVNYGYIPQTAQEDGDGLDVLIVSQAPFQPGTFARVKVIGIMGMIDTGEQDDKLVAVAADDPMYRDIENLDQLGEQQLGEIQRFFEDYKRGEEGRYVNVTGYQGPEEAQGTVQEAVALFKDLCGEQTDSVAG